MTLRQRLFFLVSVVVTVALGTALVVTAQLYATARKAHSERLREAVQSRASLIRAVARFDRLHSSEDVPGGAAAATIGQVQEAHVTSPGFGETGELLIARRRGDRISYLVPSRHAEAADLPSVPWSSELGEPMRRALRGEAGVAKLTDLRGVRVLAAYQPLPILDAGLVAKIDMSEIRAPFVRAAAVGGAACLLLAGLGALLIVRLGNPMIRQVEASEERLRLAVDASGDGLYEIHLDARPDVFSRQMYSMLGYERDEDGRGFGFFTDLLHPEDKLRWLEDATRVQQGEWDAYEVEYRLRAADGGWRHVLSRGRCVERASDGRPLRVLGTHTDVTELRIAQEEAASRARYLRVLLEAIPSPIFFKGPDGRYRDCNQAFARFEGCPRRELIGATVEDVAPPERAERYRRSDHDLLDSGGTQTYEITMKRGDGALRDVLVTKATCPDASGEAAGIVGVITDLTDLKRAERALQASEESLSRLMEVSPVPMVVADADFRGEMASRKFTEVFGYTLEEVPDLPSWFERVYPDEAQRAKVRRLWMDRILPSVHDGFELGPLRTRVRCADGTVRAVDVHAASIGDRHLVVLHDLTEHQRLQETLQRAQRLEVVGRLAGGIAHDFNNILQAVLSNVELAADGESAGELAEHLDAIRSSAERAAELTRQMLAFGRRQLLQRRRVDLDRLVEGSVDMLRRLVGETVEVLFRPGSAGRDVHVDPSQVEHVLAQLALNARAAMPDGGRLELLTRPARPTHPVGDDADVVQSDDLVCLEVRDTGHGMGPEVLERAFEPFFTTRGAGEGSGLGLPTVYGIVRQHGGAVEAESQVGRGTVIRVYLPVGDPDQERDEGSVESPQEARQGGAIGSPPAGRRTILVAEDDELVRRLAVRILERAGFVVLVTEDGARALEVFHRHRDQVDLALLDASMPGMDGPSAAAGMRRERPDLPILLATGHSPDVAMGEPGTAAGDLPVILKPYRAEALVRRIRELLGEAEVRSRPDPG